MSKRLKRNLADLKIQSFTTSNSNNANQLQSISDV
ncbi:TPA: pinensin family lanthipeptide [Pasteurella multocida]|nr:pinensin family lanthipeptide [Pasteurella multocida]